MVAHDTGLHAGRNFGRTARLSTIADNAGHDCQRVYQCVGNSREVCALQIGNTTPGRTAGADCTAVCGQPPDTRFFVNGN